MFFHVRPCAVWVQTRGFKTLRTKPRRTDSGYDGPVESEAYTPAFMKVNTKFLSKFKATRGVIDTQMVIFRAKYTFNSPTIPLLPSQGLLQREKGPEAQSLDQLLKQKNLPDNQQEAFKTGFTEGFMRSQAFTQRTQGQVAELSENTERC